MSRSEASVQPGRDVLAPDPLGDPEPPLPAETLQDLFRQMTLLRRLDSLFHELGRSGVVPFAWPSRGLEAVCAGTVAALQPDDWLYPDLRTWGVALLRGYGVAEHLHQLLGTGQDRGCGRRLPGLPSHAGGHVLSLSAHLGARAHQSLGTAWASRAAGSDALAVCYLGASELERPEPLDAIERARGLGAPLLYVLMGDKPLADDWTWRLAEHEVPHAFADGRDVLRVRSVTQKLARRCRAEHLPAAVVCELKPGVDPLQRLAEELRPLDALPLTREHAIRRAVHDEVREALVEVLGEARAHLVQRHLDAHDAQLKIG